MTAAFFLIYITAKYLDGMLLQDGRHSSSPFQIIYKNNTLIRITQIQYHVTWTSVRISITQNAV